MPKLNQLQKVRRNSRLREDYHGTKGLTENEIHDLQSILADWSAPRFTGQVG